MAFAAIAPGSGTEPQLGWLVAGFVLLVTGLAALTLKRRRDPLQSRQATNRALLYALVYGLCSAAFTRVIAGALLGREHSPWLLALGDVIFVTLGLYVWVMALAEGHAFRDYGFRSMPAGRLLLTVLMGLGAVAVYSLGPYRDLIGHHFAITADNLVFALLFSAIGSALPDEMIFRGYLMSSLDGRVSRWARVAWPALAFTAVHALRYAPGLGLGSPQWMSYIFGTALPLGLWWGLMRELGGGALWPSLISHFLIQFGNTLAGTSPAFP